MASRGGVKPAKRYIKFKNVEPVGLSFPDTSVEEPIWIFWNKGLENAPDIVKACYKSVRTYSNRDVIVLTDGNLNKYINMPQYTNQKREDGVMPLAIYTDLMRVALLEHYGGIWMDATIYLTEKIPEEILNSEFFVFHNSLRKIENPVLYPVWFILAKKHNQVIKEIRNILFSYWEKENHISEYLFSNIVITQVMKELPDVEKKMPYLNSDYSEYMVRKLGDEFVESEYEWIKSLTGIHKLTYKLDDSINKKGTVYHHIVGDI